MAHYAYALLSFLCAQSCIWWNNWLMEQMIKAVNFHRPPDQQLDTSFRNRSKTRLIEAQYRIFYANGPLNRWRSVSLILGFTFFLLTGVLFFKPNP